MMYSSTDPNRGKNASGCCSGSGCGRLRHALVRVGLVLSDVYEKLALREVSEECFLNLMRGTEEIAVTLSGLKDSDMPGLSELTTPSRREYHSLMTGLRERFWVEGPRI